MENKYYTPSIEELHVGLECEILNTNNIYQEYLISGSRSLKFILDYYDTDEPTLYVQIKYLDSDDINELGWKYDHKLTHTIHQFTKSYVTNSDKMYILKYNYMTHNLVVFSDFGTMLFDGYINNKSELRKLMQMLGII